MRTSNSKMVFKTLQVSYTPGRVGFYVNVNVNIYYEDGTINNLKSQISKYYFSKFEGKFIYLQNPKNDEKMACVTAWASCLE